MTPSALRLLVEQGHGIYLNGHRIRGYGYSTEYPTYQSIMLNDYTVKNRLKKGVNTLAVFVTLRYEQDRDGDGYHPVGQIDMYIEGLKKEALEL